LQQGAFIDFVTYKYPEHLAKKLVGKKQVTFISSPAQLSRLVADNVVASSGCQLDLIVSSGGPLGDQDAIDLAQQFGLAITQVYGSTETGGIAYRKVDSLVPAPWTPFDDIDVARDPTTQCLLLTSPYLNNECVLLDDKIRLEAGGGFSLLGRADRTIKLEEKRLDLDAMEHRLVSHDMVEQVRLHLIAGSRMTLCAAIVLSEHGVNELQQQGKRALNEQLKQYLLGHFERVCLPRKWRYIDQLPYNLQGKLIHKELESLFE